MPEETINKLIERVETGGFETTDLKQEALRACIEQLRPVDRGLILRRYIEENSLGKLATEVGRSAESLKVSLHRIRMVLKACVIRKIKVWEVTS